MAKPSVIAAKTAQAQAEQADALKALVEQVARLEAKIDQLIEAKAPAKATKEKSG